MEFYIGSFTNCKVLVQVNRGEITEITITVTDSTPWNIQKGSENKHKRIWPHLEMKGIIKYEASAAESFIVSLECFHLESFLRKEEVTSGSSQYSLCLPPCWDQPQGWPLASDTQHDATVFKSSWVMKRRGGTQTVLSAWPTWVIIWSLLALCSGELGSISCRISVIGVQKKKMEMIQMLSGKSASHFTHMCACFSSENTWHGR